jgi:hypothetical protein
MTNEQKYRADEVCEQVGISPHTLIRWYYWENCELRDGIVEERYLPIPQKDISMRGKPKFWTKKQVEQLKEFKNNMVNGRHGRYGKYSNPLHKKEDKVNE